MAEVKKEGMGKSGLMALAALVVILAVSNIYIYTSLQNQITTLTTEKTNLQSQVTTLTNEKNALNTEYQAYKATHTYTDSQYNALNTAYEDYQSTHSYTDTEYDDLLDDRDFYYDVASLNYYQVFADRETVYHAPGYYYYWPFEIYYASYIEVTVWTSTVANAYVRATYYAYGVDFDQTIYVGGAGTATFPLLPCDNLEIIVGNAYNAGATYTVSIILYY